MGLSSSLRPDGEGEIKSRLSDRPFWTGQETDQLRFRDDSINVRIGNLDGNIVGAIQFYNLHTYEMVLVENDSLRPDQEIGSRYTPGELAASGREASGVSRHHKSIKSTPLTSLL